MTIVRVFSRPLASALLLFVSVFLTSGCVRFQEVALYTGVEQAPIPEAPRKLSLAVEPVIYEEQTDDTVWFQDDERCTQGSVTSEVSHQGDRSIEVSWNRGADGCEWAGLGIGWDGWVGKDISEVLPHAAIEMYVRSRDGVMYGLPIVLTFEDYAGGMGFAYTGNRYFERPVIDEKWQRVVVPLAAFDLEIENLDPTNIKQLMFELQQSGSIYLDDIRLIFYEPEKQEPWLIEAPRPDPTVLPIQLFDDAFINDNGWGLVTDECQSVEPTVENPSEGTISLRLRWDLRPETCYEAAMGVSWDRWYPVDMTPIAKRSAVQFDVRLLSGTATEIPLRIGLEDYNRQRSTASLDATYSACGQFTKEWCRVTIPVTDLEGNADLRRVKQLVMYMDEAGELFIDDLRLVETD